MQGITSLGYQVHIFSNHNIVFFEITSFRKLKNINMQAFYNDIFSHLSGVDFTQFSLHAYVDFYNSMLSSRSWTIRKSTGLATVCLM